MANYNARKPGFLKGWQITVADLMFRGFSDKQIAKELWPEKTTDKEIKSACNRIRLLRRTDKFQEYYRTLVTEWSSHHVGKALNKLVEQIDSDQAWLANKAANDVIQHSKQMLTGVDDGTVVVKVEGMPELGTPDD